MPEKPKRGKVTPKFLARRARHDAKRKAERAAGVDPVRWIMIDCRKSDKVKGRDFDLTHDFVEGLIASGCCYCGETKLRMTLDRIDNTKGHTRDNVKPACIRCNYARRDMPFDAWMCLVHGLREAREKGLFGEWTGRTR